MANTQAGKDKGLGFAFSEEMGRGEVVGKAVDGTEMEGRRIKVDVAKAQGGKGGKDSRGPKGGGNDGKSSRELQAIREEEEGGKKGNRRSRPKKD